MNELAFIIVSVVLIIPFLLATVGEEVSALFTHFIDSLFRSDVERKLIALRRVHLDR